MTTTVVVMTCSTCGIRAGIETKLRKCTGCRLDMYCGPQCQKAAWGDHKPVCRRLGAPEGAGRRLAGVRRRIGAWLTDQFNLECITMVVNRSCHAARGRLAGRTPAFFITLEDDETWKMTVGEVPASDVQRFAASSASDPRVWVVFAVFGEPLIRFTVRRLEERVWSRGMTMLSEAAVRLLPLASGYASGAVAIEAALGASLSSLVRRPAAPMNRGIQRILDC